MVGVSPFSSATRSAAWQIETHVRYAWRAEPRLAWKSSKVGSTMISRYRASVLTPSVFTPMPGRSPRERRSAGTSAPANGSAPRQQQIRIFASLRADRAPRLARCRRKVSALHGLGIEEFLHARDDPSILRRAGNTQRAALSRHHA